MNKFILGVASCALLLASCSGNERFENIVNSRVIGFENLNDRITKAANDQGANYGVYAKATGNATEFYKFENREVVSHPAGDTYGKPELWPSYALDFYAYAPHSGFFPYVFTPTTGAVTYRINHDGQEDLTFAKAENLTHASGDVVAFHFNHMLSKVQLGDVALADNLVEAGYRLEALSQCKIKIYVEKNRATNNLYTQGEWEVLHAWDPDNNPVDGVLYSDAKAYYIMPQPISADKVVKIQLYGLKIMKGEMVHEADVSVKFAWVPRHAVKNTKPTLGADGVFLKGRRYTINFTLGSDATKPDITDPENPEIPGEPIFDDYIGFSMSVVDWKVEDMSTGIEDIKPEVKIPTVVIPEGTFWMGSPESEVGRSLDELLHEVVLSAFRMSKFEITNAQYCEFLNKNSIGADGKWASGNYPTQVLINADGFTWNGSKWLPKTGFDNYPVIYVTWYGATEFARWVGGRIPTEAEWEYACRAGTTSEFNIERDLTANDASYFPSSPALKPVGYYAPNKWGLYGMHGNAWEWCADWYEQFYYQNSPKENPKGPKSGTVRVMRGGSYTHNAKGCRSAYRGNQAPEVKNNISGFRVAFPL